MCLHLTQKKNALVLPFKNASWIAWVCGQMQILFAPGQAASLTFPWRSSFNVSTKSKIQRVQNSPSAFLPGTLWFQKFKKMRYYIASGKSPNIVEKYQITGKVFFNLSDGIFFNVWLSISTSKKFLTKWMNKNDQVYIFIPVMCRTKQYSNTFEVKMIPRIKTFDN